MALNDPVLRASIQIVNASKNAPPLRKWATGAGVRVLQASLLDLGYRMPRTTRDAGRPDGVYGSETVSVVTQFQVDNHLEHDGVAGRQTIAKIDALLTAKGSAASKTVPRPYVPYTKPPEYRIGHDDPFVPLDQERRHGRPGGPSERGLVIWAAMVELVDKGQLSIVLPDGVKAMRHYLRNLGTPLELPLDKMVIENPTVKQAYLDEVEQACNFVEQQPLGNYNITSISTMILYANDTTNWATAAGGVRGWGKGKARVKEDDQGRHYELYFEFKFKDRYNFDKDEEKGFPVPIKLPVNMGKEKKFIPGSAGDVYVHGDELVINDSLLARLHDEGLAKNFVTHGSFIRYLSWRHGEKITWTQADPRAP